jgi:DNA-binding response OmpR family regulator
VPKKYTIATDVRGKLTTRNRLARASALLRQRGYMVVEPGAGQSTQTIVVGPLALDIASLKLTYGTRQIALTTFKLLLLKALMEAEGAWCSRRALRKILWGEFVPPSDALAVHMHHLREQLHRLIGMDAIVSSRLRGFRLAFELFGDDREIQS